MIRRHVTINMSWDGTEQLTVITMIWRSMRKAVAVDVRLRRWSKQAECTWWMEVCSIWPVLLFYIKEARAQKIGLKSILKYDLCKSLSKELCCKMADTKTFVDYIFEKMKNACNLRYRNSFLCRWTRKWPPHNEWYIENVLDCEHFSSKLAHGTYLFVYALLRSYLDF